MAHRLGPDDEDMLRAERRGADFGVYVTVRLPQHRVADAAAAWGQVVRAWPSLTARVVTVDGGHAILASPPAEPSELASAEPLHDRTILATDGGWLARHRVLPGVGLELLLHHLVIDADSLAAVLADLDTVLAGDRPIGSPDWPWAVGEPAPEQPPAPDTLAERFTMAEPRTPTQRPQHSLPRKRRPGPGTHASHQLDPALVTRIGAAARVAGVSPFAIHWAAASRYAAVGAPHPRPASAGSATPTQPRVPLAAVVSRRLLAQRPSRAGNATAYLAVDLPAAAPGRDGVRAAFEAFLSGWRGLLPPGTPTRDRLLVSSAQAPDADGYRVLQQVCLGDYVVKYPRHLQVQALDARGEQVLIEGYAATGGAVLVQAHLQALARLLDELLPTEAPTPTASTPTASTPTASITGLTTGLTPGLTPRPTTLSTGAPTSPPRGPLERILAADPATALRDLDISSFDVLEVLDGLDRRGIRAGVDTFYSWERVGDVLTHLAEAVAAGTPDQGPGRPRHPDPPNRAHPTGVAAQEPVVLGHLSDIFIDAVRHDEPDRYAVGYTYVVDPALRLDQQQVAAACQRVVDRHPGLGAQLGFDRRGVLLRAGATTVRVRTVSRPGLAALADPQPLSVRAPAHLADIAVGTLTEGGGPRVAVQLTLHHLLVDHVGLSALVDDLARELRGEPAWPSTGWAELAEPLAQARARAVQVWRADPLPTGLAPIGVGGLTPGHHTQLRLPWGRSDGRVLLGDELTPVCAALAQWTGTRRGLIGSVHHGRVVPGSERLVGALARVLPVPFDLDDPAVLRAGVRRVLAGQAACLADLSLPPGGLPVAFHALRGSDQLPAGLVHRIEAPSRTKFAVLVTLLIGADGQDSVLEVTVDTDRYAAADAARLGRLLAEARATHRHPSAATPTSALPVGSLA